MYQAWAKGQPPPVYPTNPTFIPPLAQSQDHPATDSSPSFPIYQHYQSTTSQTPPAPPTKPVPYPPPPATPVFVAPPPVTLHRSSSEPLLQAHDNQYYPPEPTFKAPEPYSYTPHFDLPMEAEKPSKNPE
ncbi:extensin-like [Nicotiana sylvestris]|uniref:extensin-like n=1 Tax=Nicotiana sylvestris TaxID=4096 RepID=UPI00388C753A